VVIIFHPKKSAHIRQQQQSYTYRKVARDVRFFHDPPPRILEALDCGMLLEPLFDSLAGGEASGLQFTHDDCTVLAGYRVPRAELVAVGVNRGRNAMPC